MTISLFPTVYPTKKDNIQNQTYCKHNNKARNEIGIVCRDCGLQLDEFNVSYKEDPIYDIPIEKKQKIPNIHVKGLFYNKVPTWWFRNGDQKYLSVILSQMRIDFLKKNLTEEIRILKKRIFYEQIKICSINTLMLATIYLSAIKKGIFVEKADLLQYLDKSKKLFNSVLRIIIGLYPELRPEPNDYFKIVSKSLFLDYETTEFAKKILEKYPLKFRGSYWKRSFSALMISFYIRKDKYLSIEGQARKFAKSYRGYITNFKKTLENFGIEFNKGKFSIKILKDRIGIV